MSLFEHCPLTRRSFLAVGLSVTMAGLPSAGRAEANKATVPRSAVVSEQGGKKTYLLAFDMGREVMEGFSHSPKRNDRSAAP